MAEQTWHHRLAEALEKRGKKWSDLIEVTGMTKPAVYGWKPDDKGSRAKMMDGNNAARVCEFLQINPVWMFFGEGQSGLEPPAESNPATLGVNEEVRIYLVDEPFERLREAWLNSTPEWRAVLSGIADQILSNQQAAAEISKPKTGKTPISGGMEFSSDKTYASRANHKPDSKQA